MHLDTQQAVPQRASWPSFFHNSLRQAHQDTHTFDEVARSTLLHFTIKHHESSETLKQERPSFFASTCTYSMVTVFFSLSALTRISSSSRPLSISGLVTAVKRACIQRMNPTLHQLKQGYAGREQHKHVHTRFAAILCLNVCSTQSTQSDKG